MKLFYWQERLSYTCVFIFLFNGDPKKASSGSADRQHPPGTHETQYVPRFQLIILIYVVVSGPGPYPAPYGR